MSSRWRLPLAVIAALALAWGGAEALLHWRGRATMPTPGLPRVVGPETAPAPARDKAPPPAALGPDKALPPTAPGPGKGPEPALALPRVVTPEEDVRWGAGVVTTGIRAVDGDSLLRGEERLRLIGIDAPELRQTCRDPANGTTIACGRQAQAVLDALLRPGSVACTDLGTDRFGRTLVRCLNGRGDELNRAMVQSGWALATEGDPTYDAVERQAAAARRGLHALLFDRPDAWRRANPR